MLSNWDFSFSNLPGLSFLFYINCFFSSEDLDVSLWGKIGTNSTMSSVSSSSAFSGSINLNMIDGKIFKVFSIGVGFEVVNESQDNLHWFLWPSSESFSELSGLSGSSDSSVVFSVRNTSSVSEDVFEILFSFGDSKAFDGFSSLISVFIMDSEISSWWFGD